MTKRSQVQIIIILYERYVIKVIAMPNLNLILRWDSCVLDESKALRINHLGRGTRRVELCFH